MYLTNQGQNLSILNFIYSLLLFVRECVCVYVYHSVHVEVRAQSCGADSLLPSLHEFWDLNSGHQACAESTFTHWTILSTNLKLLHSFAFWIKRLDHLAYDFSFLFKRKTKKCKLWSSRWLCQSNTCVLYINSPFVY